MNAGIVPTPLPVGKSFFDRVIEDGCYYVDKTLFIKDLLDKGAEVTLFTRPRRFGKTLNQTMIKCFFENTAQIGGNNTRALFNGLNIEKAGDRYLEHQGKYPVIFLSFKEAKRNTFEESYNQLRNELISEFIRHRYAAKKISEKRNRELFEKLADGDGSFSDYSSSLKFLSGCLKNYYDKKVIILIDEYDVALESSWLYGFYDEMVNLIRPLLSSALKDNPHLQFAVMTGCLRISKESIFTGLNNLDVISVLTSRYDEYLGFTQNEMDAMLKHYNLENKTQIIKEWYNGYLFGKTEVYNPWSAINSVNDCLDNPDCLPKPYWANTSGNDIVRKLIDKADNEVKTDIETLMAGGAISKAIHEDITYDEIDKSTDNLWNFLFFTGYLKKAGERQIGVKNVFDLSVPNLELLYIYETKIQEWFRENVSQKDFSKFYEAILNGNAKVIQEELSKFLIDTISAWDYQENFYHGIMLGFLSGLRNFIVKSTSENPWERGRLARILLKNAGKMPAYPAKNEVFGGCLKSNHETGLGRCDITLKHASGRGKAVIFELKWTKDMREIEKKCDEAIKQIKDGMYAKELESECYNDIICYGVAFCKKSCEVRKLN